MICPRYRLANSYSARPILYAVPRQLLPAGYVALTTGRQAVLDHFPCASPQAVFEADRLPALYDDSADFIAV